MVIAALLILGVAWFAVAAVNRSPVATYERERITAQSLHAAKQALLAYVAQYAARAGNAPTTDFPGRMPCPESLSSIGGANDGLASSACSNVGPPFVAGRLPWRTLGVEPLADGDGERLWYVLSPNFHPVALPPASPALNFDTPGALPFEGSNVVALIIAPGKALHTLTDPGTPPASCAKVGQTASRYIPPLDPAKFFECGNATGAYENLGQSPWTNDRVIAITQAEWANAIAPAIADRLQREVAPAMMDFRTTTAAASWGQNFLPNASTIDPGIAGSQPETNNMCGNFEMRTGMPPTATVASGLCNTNWSSWSGWGVDLGVSLNFGGCAPQPTYLRCTYTVLLGGVAPSPWIVATAPRIGYSLRRFDPATIVVIRNGAPVINAVRNYSASVSSADGSATIQFEIQFPLLSLIDTLEVRIPYADDALLADTRSAWYIQHGWDRHTYYGVSPAATHDPDGSVCNPGGVVTGCMNVFGMPVPRNDKRLVLVLMGRPLPGTTQPSYTLTNYLEDQNASVGVNYDVKTVTSTFNDRVAACPYKYYDLDGVTVLSTACN